MECGSFWGLYWPFIAPESWVRSLLALGIVSLTVPRKRRGCRGRICKRNFGRDKMSVEVFLPQLRMTQKLMQPVLQSCPTTNQEMSPRRKVRHRKYSATALPPEVPIPDLSPLHDCPPHSTGPGQGGTGFRQPGPAPHSLPEGRGRVNFLAWCKEQTGLKS